MSDRQTNRRCWDAIASEYHARTEISTDDIHYGPLLPGERELGLLSDDLEGRRVLVLGCGGGQNALRFADLGADVVGVDISASQLQEARRRQSNDSRSSEFVQADMTRLDAFRDDSFDVVFSSYALQFVAEIDAVFESAQRLVVTGGRLVCSTKHPLSYHDVDDGAVVRDYYDWDGQKRWSFEDDSEGHPFEIHYHTVEQVVDSVATAGFDVDRVLAPSPTDGDVTDPPYASDYYRSKRQTMGRVPHTLILTATNGGD